MYGDHPIATAFLQHLQSQIVLISKRYSASELPMPVGSGCVIGLRKSKEGRVGVVVASARHVLEHDEHDHAEWFVSRNTLDGQTRTARFDAPDGTNPKAKAVWYSGPMYKEPATLEISLDIGALNFDNDLCPGGFFVDTEKIPVTINTEIVATAGTMVAWGGFPDHVAKLIGGHRVCFFQGHIAACVNTPGKPPSYLISGYNSPGLSGGPVWMWDDVERTAQIIGIINSYSRAGELFPGLVHASCLNPLMGYFKNVFANVVDRQGWASE
jgi:hypothetical protein